jgi:hypothetical protein
MKQSEAARGMQEALLDEEYERQVRSTPEGRKSASLRRQAERLMAAGQMREAYHLFQQALLCHPDEDDSAAAASARHDLAYILSEEGWTTSWGLSTAEQLYRRALASPARVRSKFRRAQTKKALATCLRQQCLKWRAEDPARLDEIERLFREAIEDLEECSVLGLSVLAKTHHNFANFLGEQRKDIDRAVVHHNRAHAAAVEYERTAARYGDKPDPLLQRIIHQSRLTSAGRLRERNQGRDLTRAEKLVKEVLKTGNPEYEDLAKLEWAQVLLAGKAPEGLRQAKKLLSQVRLERLRDRRHWLNLAWAFHQAGEANKALGRLERFIREGIHNRAQKAIADFAADTALFSVQPAAALAARIHAEQKQDALSAFLVLENTSGLRFAEVLSDHAWRPETPLTRSLGELRRRHMFLAYNLDELARRMEWMRPDEQREQLKEVIGTLEQRTAGAETVVPLGESLRRAIQEPVPVTYLDTLVQESVEQTQRAYLALLRADAGFAHAHREIGEELSGPRLEELLREHPDHVLIRLDVQKTLLAVAVWSEGGKLVARHASMPMQQELFSLLEQATQSPPRWDFPYPHLSELLTRLDLSPALPPGRLGRVVLLPSNLAARLPWVAMGPPGSRLIDRAGSIVWLPCLYPLRVRPAAAPPRTGDVVALPAPPGALKFLELAFSRLSDPARYLHGTEVTRAALQLATREARTLCIFTHGQHAPGKLPLLQMASGHFEPLDLGTAPRGIERIEVWACESGTHRSSDPLTPPANEGFGLDFQLLQAGARTAIGTLRSVPALSTSAIRRHYRQQVLAGEDPARALAEAQRWWIREGLPELMRLLRQNGNLHDALRAFSRTLRADDTAEASPLLLSLQGTGSHEEQEATLRHEAYFEAYFSCAAAWAGIRFVGIPDLTPEKPWTPIEERPLTPEEQSELQRLLSIMPEN